MNLTIMEWNLSRIGKVNWMSFRKNKYEVVRNVLSQDLINYININFEIHENANYFFRQPTLENPYPFGDEQSPNSFAWYGSIHSEALLQF